MTSTPGQQRMRGEGAVEVGKEVLEGEREGVEAGARHMRMGEMMGEIGQVQEVAVLVVVRLMRMRTNLGQAVQPLGVSPVLRSSRLEAGIKARAMLAALVVVTRGIGPGTDIRGQVGGAGAGPAWVLSSCSTTRMQRRDRTRTAGFLMCQFLLLVPCARF